MSRTSSADSSVDTGAEGVHVQHPLQRVRSGGRDRAIVVAVITGTVLAALVWQPWGRAGPPVASPTTLPAPVVVVDGASSASAGPTPSVPPASPRGPRPSFRPIPSGAPGSALYISLVDNEWSVVALLAPGAPASADQAWTPDATGALQAPGGPLLVRQLGGNVTERPVDRLAHPDAACQAPYGFRDQPAVHYPAGQVAYLGVTFPGMNPRARVTAVNLDRAGVALQRRTFVSVTLSGMIDGRTYTVPTSGTGGAALFTLAPPAILPVGSYRFDVEIPGVSGHRYLYACIEP